MKKFYDFLLIVCYIIFSAPTFCMCQQTECNNYPMSIEQGNEKSQSDKGSITKNEANNTKSEKQIQQENEEKFRAASREQLRLEAEQIRKNGIKMNSREAFNAGIGSSWGSESHREDILNSDFGNSKYDKNITSSADFKNLTRHRAVNFKNSTEGKMLSSGLFGIAGLVLFEMIKTTF